MKNLYYHQKKMDITSSLAALKVDSKSSNVSLTTKKDCIGSKNDKTDYSNFECNICFDIANNAVISMCGHLFCWPCLYQWLETRPTMQLCPVCRCIIYKEKIVPIYGRGDTEQKNPRSKVPPRPLPHRDAVPDQEPHLEEFDFGIEIFHVPEIELYQFEIPLNSEETVSTSLSDITEEDESYFQQVFIFETV